MWRLLHKIQKTFQKLQQNDALKNGQEAADEMNESIQKLEDSNASIKSQLDDFNETINAEIKAMPPWYGGIFFS